MVQGKTNSFGCAANFLRGRNYIGCGPFKVVRTARGDVKCQRYGHSKSLTRRRREIEIIKGFSQLQPAYRLAQDLGVDLKVVNQHLREAVFHLSELEAGRLRGEIELDEAYLGPTQGSTGPGNSREKHCFRALGAGWTG